MFSSWLGGFEEVFLASSSFFMRFPWAFQRGLKVGEEIFA